MEVNKTGAPEERMMGVAGKLVKENMSSNLKLKDSIAAFGASKDSVVGGAVVS